MVRKESIVFIAGLSLNKAAQSAFLVFIST
jgi:hypothetical protein